MDLKNQLYNINQNGTTLALEVTRLKNQLKDNDKTVTELSQENLDLRNQLGNQTLKLNDVKEEVEKSKKLIEEKDKMIVELRDKLEVKTTEGETCGVKMDKQKCMEWKQKCEQQPCLEKIKKVVQEYMNNKNWIILRRNLDNVLEHSSEAYTQLQHANSVFYVGYYNSTQLASLLLCAGLHVNTTNNLRNTMLHGAASNGALQVVKMLMDLGAGVNSRGFMNRTPLIRAARGGDLETVQLLVQAGADTTASDKAGYTALYYAKFFSHTEVARYLEQLPH